MIKRFLFCLLLGGSTYASDINVVEVMQHLENSTSLITKGFFRNRDSLIIEGLEELKKSFEQLKTFNIKVYLPKNRSQLNIIVLDNFSRIDEQIKLMQDYMDKNEKRKAYGAFEKIINSCMKCHGAIQNW